MIEIKEIIYHILNKEQHGKAKIEFNPSPVNCTEVHKKFLTALTERYAQQSGKGFGNFSQNEDACEMPKLLTEYQQLPEFYKLSQRMMNVLLDKMAQEPLSTGGTVFICLYEENAKQFMLIAILSAQMIFRVSDWQLLESESLDLKDLKYAGRINLTAWQNQEQRYVSFLKGNRDVSGYFKRFLGCDDALIAHTESKKLVELLDSFMEQQGMSFEQKSEFKKKASVYLKDLVGQGKEFVVEHFANHMWFEEPQVLIDVLSNVDNGVADGFVPDQRVLRRLSIYRGKTSHWSLTFDDDAIASGDVKVENDKIIISNIPKHFLEEISN